MIGRASPGNFGGFEAGSVRRGDLLSPFLSESGFSGFIDSQDCGNGIGNFRLVCRSKTARRPCVPYKSRHHNLFLCTFAAGFFTTEL